METRVRVSFSAENSFWIWIELSVRNKAAIPSWLCFSTSISEKFVPSLSWQITSFFRLMSSQKQSAVLFSAVVSDWALPRSALCHVSGPEESQHLLPGAETFRYPARRTDDWLGAALGLPAVVPRRHLLGWR
eukprot:COSAG06_NODE_6149_length_3084_cov_3.104188_2_plen_132_part_00